MKVKVKRRNRVLTVDKYDVNTYLQQGYDQLDDAGKVAKRATGGRTVSLAEHNKALEKIDELKAKLEELDKASKKEPKK